VIFGGKWFCPKFAFTWMGGASSCIRTAEPASRRPTATQAHAAGPVLSPSSGPVSKDGYSAASAMTLDWVLRAQPWPAARQLRLTRGSVGELACGLHRRERRVVGSEGGFLVTGEESLLPSIGSSLLLLGGFIRPCSTEDQSDNQIIIRMPAEYRGVLDSVAPRAAYRGTLPQASGSAEAAGLAGPRRRSWCIKGPKFLLYEGVDAYPVWKIYV
jgi:hypothetical protein